MTWVVTYLSVYCSQTC